MKRILIIEDDIKFKKYIEEYLTAYEYEVKGIKDFNNILDEVIKVSADLILLDINLPKFDGFYFLKVIRKTLNTPVIIISSKSEEAEQIRGMNLGADDYVAKPFNIGILLAKINAVLRRTNSKEESIIEIKNIKLFCESMAIKQGNMTLSLSLYKNFYKSLEEGKRSLAYTGREDTVFEEVFDEIREVNNNYTQLNKTSQDDPNTFMPNKVIEISIKDYLNKKDPVLDYILHYKEAEKIK